MLWDRVVINMSEISIYNYLTKEESEELVQNLKAQGIVAWSHPMSSEDLDINQVFVNDKDLEKVEDAINRFKKRIKSKTIHDKFKCPKCKAQLPYVGYKENVPFFQKIIAFGTRVVQCKKCRHEWYI